MIAEGIVQTPWRCVLSGDAADFEAIYSEYHSRIQRYVARLIGFDEAEDVAQEVFLKVSRSLGDFRSESSVLTWIYRIATNAAMDRVRTSAYRSSLDAVPLDACGDGGAAEAAPAVEAPPSAEDHAIRKEMSGCVQDLVAQLPENYRTVLVLSELEEMRNAEIAEILGVSLETVKIRLHRAKARLKAALEENCSFYRSPCNTLLCDIKPAGRAT